MSHSSKLSKPRRSLWKLGNLWFVASRSESREGNGNPLQYSCMENPMDGGAWLAAVHGVAKSRTRLSDFTFTFHFHALEKEMAIHSGVLAWRIPGTGEPAGLPSTGLHRVGHNWSDLAAAATVWLYQTVVANKLYLIRNWMWKDLVTLWVACAYKR